MKPVKIQLVKSICRKIDSTVTHKININVEWEVFDYVTNVRSTVKDELNK